MKSTWHASPLHLLGVGRDKDLEENVLEKARNVFVLEAGFVMGGEGGGGGEIFPVGKKILG